MCVCVCVCMHLDLSQTGQRCMLAPAQHMHTLAIGRILLLQAYFMDFIQNHDKNGFEARS